MKRDAPAGQPSPAVARDAGSLRAQLGRAVGDALRAVRSAGANTAAPSKQRLSDVLWHDRSMLALHATVSSPSGAAVDAPSAGDTSVEIVSDGEVAEWFEAALEEPAPAPEARDADSTAFAAAVEIAAAESERSRELEASPPDEVTAVVLADPRVASTEPAVPSSPKPASTLASPPSAERSPERVAEIVVVPAPAAVEPARVSAPAPGKDDELAFEEPICTRSMARLLAGQGHARRALAIYDVLLKTNGSDAALRAEADALRQA